MDKKELRSLVAYVSDQLAEGLPKGGASLMITADGEGGVCCHVMGKRTDILSAVDVALEQNDIIFDIVEAATKIAALKREIKTDFDSLIDELLSELKKKKEASTEAVDENAADHKEDEAGE